MNTPTVSVVIPTFNYARFVVEAVRSVLAQTYRDYETIVVDDGSTDGTREALAPVMDRIRYIPQENLGLSAARNTGIRAARGHLIALLDADDLWYPDKLAAQVQYLDRNPELGLLACGDVRWTEGSAHPVELPAVDLAQPVAVQTITMENLILGSRFGPSGVIARKRCFDEVGWFDVSLRSAEDLDMWIRIADRFPVARLEVPLWVYRLHGLSMQRVTRRMEENTLRVMEKVFQGSPPLSRSRRLRRQALAKVAQNMAYGYRDGQVYPASIGRIFRSLWFWPFSCPDDERYGPVARLKLLTYVSGQAVRHHFRSRLGGRSNAPEVVREAPG